MGVIRRAVIRYLGVTHLLEVILNLGAIRLLEVILNLGATRLLELTLLLIRGPLLTGNGRSARCRATHRVDRRLPSQLRLCHLVVRQTRSRLVIYTIPFQLGVWTRIMLLPTHPQRHPTRLSPPSRPNRTIALPKYVLWSIVLLMCVRRSMSRRMYAYRTFRRRIMSLLSCVSLLQASVLRAL